MKVAAFILFAQANAISERKVPPRTPSQRMETLNRFALSWVDNRIIGVGSDENGGGELMNRPKRGANIREAFQRTITFMLAAFTKVRPNGSGLRRCGYFNPNVANGGPRPAEQRRRRQDWVEVELAHLEQGEWNWNIKRRRREADAFFDPFDAYEDDQQRGIAGQVRLSTNLDLAFKQIATALRKWALRYISECHGQRVNQIHTERLQVIMEASIAMVEERTGEKMVDFCEKLWADTVPEGTQTNCG